MVESYKAATLINPSTRYFLLLHKNQMENFLGWQNLIFHYRFFDNKLCHQMAAQVVNSFVGSDWPEHLDFDYLRLMLIVFWRLFKMSAPYEELPESQVLVRSRCSIKHTLSTPSPECIWFMYTRLEQRCSLLSICSFMYIPTYPSTFKDLHQIGGGVGVQTDTYKGDSDTACKQLDVNYYDYDLGTDINHRFI